MRITNNTERNNWINGIKQYGRQFDDIIDVYNDSNNAFGTFDDIILGTFTQEDINRVDYSCDSSLFKSDMGKLVVDINKSSSSFNLLEKGKLLRYRQRLLDDNGSVTATCDYKFFIITEIEEQKDKNSVSVTCYDHMIKAMKDYESPKKRSTDRTFVDDKLYYELENDVYTLYKGARTGDPFVLNLYENELTYPISVESYLRNLGSWLIHNSNLYPIIIENGNIRWSAYNLNNNITQEHYIDSDGNKMGYTYRDILDDIAECIGGRIKIRYSLSNNQWEIQFQISGIVSDYGATIDENILNDKNVNIGTLYSPNVIVLSRASDSDNIHYPTTLPQTPVEVKISDNPILEQDNREDFIQGIYKNIEGLSFYINDYVTKGICINEIGDKYTTTINNVNYSCLMLSDNMIRTTGLKENIHTDEPQQSVTDFKYSSSTDKVEIASRNAKILVDKANGRIDQIVEAVGEDGEVTTASIVQSINDSGSQIQLNADKIYINGVTFDNDQNMTITEGTINIQQAPGDNSLYTFYDDDIDNTKDEASILPVGLFTDRLDTNNNMLDIGEYYYSGFHIKDEWNNHSYGDALSIGYYDNNGNIRAVFNGYENYIIVKSLVAQASRPSTPNFDHQYPLDRASKRLDIVTSEMNNSGYKPSGDGWVETFFWDNSQTYDTQLYIPNYSERDLQIRHRDGGSWQNNWTTIPSMTDGFIRGMKIPYAYIRLSSPMTMGNLTAWDTHIISFSLGSFSYDTSFSSMFERSASTIKCKFTGKVLIMRHLSTDFQGEIDIADEWSWFTATNTKQNHSVVIKNVNENDTINFAFSGGMSGTITIYSARMIIIRLE